MENKLNFEELKGNGEMTPIPGFSPEMYLCHCPSGNVYSLISNKWMLQGSKGSGDDNKYLRTALRDMEGNYHLMYLHEIIMSSHMGIKKSEWRAMGLEVDHIDNKATKNNSISNLRLATSAAQKKNSSYRFWNKVRLSNEVANQLRVEFKKWTGSKVEWYKMKGNELGVTARSIQNIILGNTYKVIED
ncbi:hypothetical protein [Neobacillus cucumis]|uniref:hypothetical protein n=1 Tax=Neobacillus cucumis TaxID=1740721 RepID=UPI002E239B3A|nr:hypothetical protein [Neobacillus cucumis]